MTIKSLKYIALLGAFSSLSAWNSAYGADQPLKELVIPKLDGMKELVKRSELAKVLSTAPVEKLKTISGFEAYTPVNGDSSGFLAGKITYYNSMIKIFNSKLQQGNANPQQPAQVANQNGGQQPAQQVVQVPQPQQVIQGVPQGQYDLLNQQYQQLLAQPPQQVIQGVPQAQYDQLNQQYQQLLAQPPQQVIQGVPQAQYDQLNQQYQQLLAQPAQQVIQGVPQAQYDQLDQQYQQLLAQYQGYLSPQEHADQLAQARKLALDEAQATIEMFEQEAEELRAQLAALQANQQPNQPINNAAPVLPPSISGANPPPPPPPPPPSGQAPAPSPAKQPVVDPSGVVLKKIGHPENKTVIPTPEELASGQGNLKPGVAYTPEVAPRPLVSKETQDRGNLLATIRLGTKLNKPYPVQFKHLPKEYENFWSGYQKKLNKNDLSQEQQLTLEKAVMEILSKTFVPATIMIEKPDVQQGEKPDVQQGEKLAYNLEDILKKAMAAHRGNMNESDDDVDNSDWGDDDDQDSVRYEEEKDEPEIPVVKSADKAEGDQDDEQIGLEKLKTIYTRQSFRDALEIDPGKLWDKYDWLLWEYQNYKSDKQRRVITSAVDAYLAENPEKLLLSSVVGTRNDGARTNSMMQSVVYVSGK